MTSHTEPPLLEALSAGRRADARWLLCDVSLSLAAGERLAIVGPSGSGKTLLLRVLAFLDPLDSGEVRWNGKPIAATEAPAFRRRVTYLHQRPALVEGSVEDNLRQPFSLRVHRDRHFDRSRVVSLLKSVGRDEPFLAKQQRDLSGGEAQLTALLRAVQLDPDVLLLDEPTSALDADAVQRVERLLAEWRAEAPRRRATVWVTHDMPQAQRVADCIYRIEDGRLTRASDVR